MRAHHFLRDCLHGLSKQHVEFVRHFSYFHFDVDVDVYSHLVCLSNLNLCKCKCKRICVIWHAAFYSIINSFCSHTFLSSIFVFCSFHFCV